MTDQPHEIILDHLRAIRSDIAELKTGQRDLKEAVNSLRADVHSLRGDMLRQERALAAVEVDLDRIKTRLDLSDG